MTPDDRAGYLAAETAGWLRQVMEQISDLSARRDLVAVAEQCFADGNTAGYDRGYADGRADVAAQTVAAVLAEQGVTPPDPGQVEGPPPEPPGAAVNPTWPSGTWAPPRATESA